jgi:hypothetical protein
MVNVIMVNAQSLRSECADFRNILRVLRRFLYFKNPVKYTRRLQINHPSAASPGGVREKHSIFINNIDPLSEYS